MNGPDLHSVNPMSLFSDPFRGPELRRIYADIWSLAWPAFVAQGLRSVVMFITRAIMGQLGDKAFNSVNVGMMVFMVIITVIAAVAVGTTALVAQAWGAGDRRQAGRILQQSLMWGLILSVAIAILGMPLSRLMFVMLGADRETMELGSEFMVWLFAAIPFMGIGFFLAAALRAAGDTRTPMYAGLAMGILSVVLSYGLILGRLGMPRLETLGAALAIDGAFFVFTLILALLFIANRTLLKLPKRGWKLDLKTGREIFKIGIPSAAEWIMIQLGILIYTFVIYKYGEAAVAGYFTGIAILTFAQTPAFGFQVAGATLVGQSVGARRFDRAESVFRHCAIMGFAFMALVGIFVAVLATEPNLARAFGELSDESIRHARIYTVFVVFVMPLMGVSFAVAGGLRGAGDTVPPLVASSVGVFGGRILTAITVYYLFQPPIIIIWASMFPDLILRIGIMALRLRTGKWKKVRLTGGQEKAPGP